MLNKTRALLENLGHSPNRKLGQNFLIDANIVRKSIAMAEILKDDAVVEIGPGLGMLTRALLEADAEVWAVERDPALARHLEENLLPHYPRLSLIEGDCLSHPRAHLPKTRTGNFKVVANLPYAVSTPWMDAILSGPLPQRMVLMLQKEAANRYCAVHGSKNFGAISIFLQSAYRMHSRHFVSASCFHPPPKVDSVLLRLDLLRNPVCFPTAASEQIRKLFTRRRKQLGTLCKGEQCPRLSEWFEQLVASGIKATVRPEEVPIEQWQYLARVLSGAQPVKSEPIQENC